MRAGPYKKAIGTRSLFAPCEDTARRRPSANQEESPQQTLTLPAPDIFQENVIEVTGGRGAFSILRKGVSHGLEGWFLGETCVV